MQRQPARQSQPLTGSSENKNALAIPIFHLSHHSQSHANHGGEQTDQPEALHNLCFAPAEQFKVQMDGSHFEEAFAFGQLEIDDL